MVGLQVEDVSDSTKKKQLLKNIKNQKQILHLVTNCEDSPEKSYNATVVYLRNKLVKHKAMLEPKKVVKNSTMLNTRTEDSLNQLFKTSMSINDSPPSEEKTYEDVMLTIHHLSTEMTVFQVYNTLQSSTVRESLDIPKSIWLELEPAFKKRVNEIRGQIRARKLEKSRTSNSGGAIPSQYPTKANKMTKESAINNVLAMVESTIDSYDTDDDMEEDLIAHAKTVIQEEDITVRAHLEYADQYSDSIYAISDGGADSCVLGKNVLVTEYTDRYARLVGYDPENTKSARIPIVTGYIKVKAHNGIPVLLKINEAPYNAHSPITLLSEYQVREHKYIIDSVATKHKTVNGFGTQRLQLSEVVHIPFLDRGGIMGFEMLPIEESDLDVIDPKYDVFELTSTNKWRPSKFKINTGITLHTTNEWDTLMSQMEEPTTDEKANSFLTDSVDDFLNQLSVEELTGRGANELCDTELQAQVLTTQLQFGESQTAKAFHSAVKPWHRVMYSDVDPYKLRPFLGFRPVEVVKKTLEHTTQLAKSSIRYPLRPHVKARNPWANVNRLDEVVSTDPMYSNCPSLHHGFNGAQVFYGSKSHCIDLYGFKSKSQFPKLYKDFIREQGAPSLLRRDNAKEENSEEVLDINRKLIIKDQYSEPHHQHQNTVESCGIRYIKQQTHVIMDQQNVPDSAWYLCAKYVAQVHDICYDNTLKMTPYEKRHGVTPDISAYLQHRFWDPVLFFDHEAKWPATKEKSGRWVGVAENVGDTLTYYIVDDQTKQLLTRSAVRPYNSNSRVKWDPDFLNQSTKSTAQHGGDIKPHPDKIKELLNNALDQYDEDEAEPKPHPVIVTEPGHKPHKPLTSTRKQKGYSSLVHEPLDTMQMLVPKSECDLYKGNAKLRLQGTPIKRDESIPTFTTPAKVQKGKKRFKPFETSRFDPNDRYEGTNSGEPMLPTRGAKKKSKPMRRSARIKDQNDPLKVEKTIRRTRWKGSQPSRLAKLSKTMLVGTMFLPTHIMAVSHIPLPQLPAQVPLKEQTFQQPLSRSKHLTKLRAYHAVLDKWNSKDLEENVRWNLKKVIDKRIVSYPGEDRRVLLKVELEDGPKKWMTLDDLQMADPHLAIDYAVQNELQHDVEFGWVPEYTNFDFDIVEMVQAYKAAKELKVKFKFGVEVPSSTKRALEIDRENGNQAWGEAIKLELSQILGYRVFNVLQHGELMPKGYQRIPYHIVYDVKFDGRLKARLVAGGNRSPEVHREDVFSAVVSMEGVRLGFLMARMNGLRVCAGDVGNAFLHGTTHEKLYIIAGPEFGPELQGKRLIIHKSLYGLRTSAARYHEHLSVTLRKLGFEPTKADSDLWMRTHEDGHYEYVARYVDDVIAFAKDPLAIMKQLEDTYVMKGVGTPRYYLGGDVKQLDEQWNRYGMYESFSAETYLDNVLPKISNMLGIHYKKRHTPFDEKYHAELDETPLVSVERISLYRSLIGSGNWILTLGRFDIAYSLSTLARYNNAPREGHFNAVIRVFEYLNTHKNGEIVIDTSEAPVRKTTSLSRGFNWSEFYPDVKEQIPEDMPNPQGKMASITCYVDADHARDNVTRRSVTGIVLLINNTPMMYLSKRQGTVETSTYGSELVASRIAVDMIIEQRYKLRMLGIKLEKTSLLVGDNMSVVLNTTLPSSNLKKKHQACNFHRVREMIAGSILSYGHIVSTENVADICTKPLGRQAFAYLTKKYLFRDPPALEKAKSVNK